MNKKENALSARFDIYNPKRSQLIAIFLYCGLKLSNKYYLLAHS